MRPDSVLDTEALPQSPDNTDVVQSAGETDIQRAPEWFRKNRSTIRSNSQAAATDDRPSQTTQPVSVETGHLPPPLPPQQMPRRQKRRKNDPDIEPGDEQPLAWQERVQRWITGSEGLGYLLSSITHISILLILTLILLPQIRGERGTSLLGSRSDKQDEVELLDTKMNLPELVQQAEPPKVIMPVDIASSMRETELPDDFSARLQASVGNGLGKQDQLTGGLDLGEFGGEPGKNAVVKGSFTAWTVPEDPEPGEDYKIVVRVKLPDTVKSRYPVKDLSGVVIGTDGYRQTIPGVTKLKYLRVVKGYTQFDVTVPGAFRLVKDKIVVRSNMLEEEQLLEIVF